MCGSFLPAAQLFVTLLPLRISSGGVSAIKQGGTSQSARIREQSLPPQAKAQGRPILLTKGALGLNPKERQEHGSKTKGFTADSVGTCKSANSKSNKSKKKNSQQADHWQSTQQYMDVDVTMSGPGSFFERPPEGTLWGLSRPETSFVRQTPSTWRT